MAYKLTINEEYFLEFVQGILIPQMAPFHDFLNRTIVVSDNFSIHQVLEIVEKFRKAGIMVLFLQPYSPDYMPNELCSGYIKYLNSADDMMHVVSDLSIIVFLIKK